MMSSLGAHFLKASVFSLLITILSCSDSQRKNSSSSRTEVFSLLGEQLYPVLLDSSTHAIYSENLRRSQSDYSDNPNNASAIIWLGRRTAYLGNFQKAIAIFSEGIKKHPKDARMYRHRGHRYLTIRQLSKAVHDFETAAQLIEGQDDKIEPDGLPNRMNIPTSTLQSNIWYHLGLAHYLLGDLDAALRAYKKGMVVAKNNDILVANTYWMYMTLRRLGLKESADALLTDVGDDFHVIENYSYRDLLLLFKERLSESDLLENGGDALQNATIVYGIANRRCLDADIAGAEKLLHSIISSKYWPAFGYLAAEADLTYGRCVEKELS